MNEEPKHKVTELVTVKSKEPKVNKHEDKPSVPNTPIKL